MKFSKLALIGIVPIVALIFFACQKADLKPALTSNAKGNGGTVTPSSGPAFTLALPDFGINCTTSSSYCFNTTLLTNGGSVPGGQTQIYATITTVSEPTTVLYTSATLSASQGEVCFSDLALLPGNYLVHVYFSHAPSENATPQHGTFEFPLTVNSAENCVTTSCETTGLTFSRNPVIVLDDQLRPIQVNVTYTVMNCTTDQNFTNLKIQGGLVNKAGDPSLSTAGSTGTIASFDKKKNAGNYIITGYFNLSPGQVGLFNVIYSVATDCNNYLTGEWSVKNGPAVLISTDLAGSAPNYMNRLRVECNP